MSDPMPSLEASSPTHNNPLSPSSASGDPSLTSVSTAHAPLPSPPWQFLLVASACVAPAMMLHYLLIRRNINSLSKQLVAVKAAHEASLQRAAGLDTARYRLERHAVDMDILRSELSKHKTAHGKKIGEVVVGLKSLKKVVDNERQSREQMTESISAINTEVQRITSQLKGTKALHQDGTQNVTLSLDSGTLEELGSSLAHVAAFMQEVETLEGLEGKGTDPRGIERLRHLAQKLHGMASSPPPKTEARGDEKTKGDGKEKGDGRHPSWSTNFLWRSRGFTMKDAMKDDMQT